MSPRHTVRLLRGNVVGTLTAGLIEDDTFAPERFEIVICAVADGSVRGRIAAGSDAVEAQGLLELLQDRARHMTVEAFIDDYGAGR